MRLLLIAIALTLFSAPSAHAQDSLLQSNTTMAILVAFPDENIRIPDKRGLTNTVSNWLDWNDDGCLMVGHAGIILIDPADSSSCYWDFGRYPQREDSLGPRPKNMGLARSCHTVAGFQLPKAEIREDTLRNTRELITALDATPEFQSYGRITASVYYHLSFDAMVDKAREIESMGYIAYGAPFRQYCSRFARDVACAGGAEFGFLTFSGKQNVRQTLKRFPDQEKIVVR